MVLDQELRMEPDLTTSQDQPANAKAAAKDSAPSLNYAQPQRFARLRRYLRPGSLWAA
jgi:hypothetical protein